MEQLNYFVSSRGILKSCSFSNKNPESSSSYIDSNFLNEITENDTIYVCAAALYNFSKNYLPLIDKPFVLVSGDSDEHINESFINNDFVKNILESKYLNHWYAQNLVTTNEKISHLPAGLDYHTMQQNSGSWGMVNQSPMAQERALINVFAKSPAFENRYFNGYCNWHFQMDRGDRKECHQKIDPEISFYEKNILPRYTGWLRQSKCMFVISPQGVGMDAHRTWEALALGCVPVLKKSEFTLLFDGLPVLIIEEWTDFNKSNIMNYLDYFRFTKFNFSKIFNQYWINLINNRKTMELPLMTLSEFKDFICLDSF